MKSPIFVDTRAADDKALASLAASRTNDEMQVMLAARRRSGIPGGLGDSRAIRAAIHANLTRQISRVAAGMIVEQTHETG